MNDDSENLFRIKGITENGFSYEIEFQSLDNEEMIVQSFLSMESLLERISLVKRLRQKCKFHDIGLYVPTEKKLTQDIHLCLSASASYPNELSRQFIEDALEIPYNSYKVYASAKEYDSSQYLTLTPNKGIKISLDGVVWTASALPEGSN